MVSGGTWLQILMVDSIATRLFGDSVFDNKSVVGEQASWPTGWPAHHVFGVQLFRRFRFYMCFDMFTSLWMHFPYYLGYFSYWGYFSIPSIASSQNGWSTCTTPRQTRLAPQTSAQARVMKSIPTSLAPLKWKFMQITMEFIDTIILRSI